MFTVAGLFPLQSVMLLMPCHMLLVLLVLNCSSTLFSTHFLMKHVTESEYASMSSSDAARNMSQST